jgi:hypothetical protein
MALIGKLKANRPRGAWPDGRESPTPAQAAYRLPLPVVGEIAGARVRGIIDLLDTSGRIIDVKTAARKPSRIKTRGDCRPALKAADHPETPHVDLRTQGCHAPSIPAVCLSRLFSPVISLLHSGAM